MSIVDKFVIQEHFFGQDSICIPFWMVNFVIVWLQYDSWLKFLFLIFAQLY